ncbi:MAG: aminotransferase class V-fold PLP-dependent enzyme [Pseudomonadota bacterium]
MTVPLDLDFVRAQFPAFAEPTLKGQAHFENAGGSYACGQVIDRLHRYYCATKVQPYHPFPAAAEAGAQMDAAYTALARYLNVDVDEVHIGPSTTQNTYVLARAMATGLLVPGDELIVTNQDHEANGGSWRRLAERGVVVREWRVDAQTGELDPAELDDLMTERTRLLCFPHCSNIVAHVNPVAAICARARAAGVATVVDGVSYAGHGLPDVDALGCDVYLFSLYKVYGPHQGVMAVRRGFAERLDNQSHFFNAGETRKRLVPAGPDHAQVAASAGVAAYFDALDAHHGGADDDGRPARVRALLHAAETRLLGGLLDAVTRVPGLRLLGPGDAARRAPTVSLATPGRDPVALARALGERGVMCAGGHFYSYRTVEALGLDPSEGVLRLSFVHYTSDAEVDQAIAALDAVMHA